MSVFDYQQASMEGYDHHFALIEYRPVCMNVYLPDLLGNPEYQAFIVGRAERAMLKDLKLYLDWCKANFGRRGKRWRGGMATSANNARLAALSFRDDTDAVLFKLAFPEAVGQTKD